LSTSGLNMTLKVATNTMSFTLGVSRVNSLQSQREVDFSQRELRM
jgi:hypothetical protein